MATSSSPSEVKVPLHRNPKARALAFQAIVVIVVGWLVYSILSNTIANLEARGIKTGVSFFDSIAPFALPLEFSTFIDYELGETTYWEIFLIGIQNTILVSIFGIFATTILGFVVGIARLSPNWLLSKIAEVYIEVIRNTPLLLQLFFWNFAVFLPAMPAARESLTWFDGAVVANKTGLTVPEPIVVDHTLFALALVIFVALVWHHVRSTRNARRHFEETGEIRSLLLPVGGAWLVGLVALWFILDRSITFEYPVLGTFNYSGGMTFILEGFVLWFGLTLYTAAFIAENVRGGVQAVPKGQTEAARALGFHWLKTLQLIIIPQAMRVIIPPTISQYLNLTKNSSLAVAVAYPDIVNVWAGISLNQTGQALIIIAMTIAVYEILSLLTSAILNYYNSRVQLTER